MGKSDTSDLQVPGSMVLFLWMMMLCIAIEPWGISACSGLSSGATPSILVLDLVCFLGTKF
jgi:hypothetical protein